MNSGAREFYENQLTQLQSVSEGLIVYGASKLGWYALQSIKQLQGNFFCFCDQSADELGNQFHGEPVIKPVELQRFPHCKVLVAIFNDSGAESVREVFLGQGIELLDIDPYAFLYHFFIEIARREVNKNKFAESIAQLKRYYADRNAVLDSVEPDLLVSPLVTINATERCNLKCVDCSQLIPFHKNPRNFDLDTIIDDVKAYCRSIDLVPEISLQGGDPFLHPQIGDICLALSTIENIVFINVTTNGTLLPIDGSWQKFRAAGVDMHQSDYKRISKRQELIFSLCEQNQIYCDINFVFKDEEWRRVAIKDYSRSEQENHELYERCIESGTCAHILDGKLYRCGIAAHGATQKKFPSQCGRDFVYLREDEAPNTADILKLLANKTRALNACSYCSLMDGERVTPAIQLTPKNKRILESGGSFK